MLTSLLLTLVLAADPAPNAEPTISDCVIASIDDRPVPGADAGVLTSLKVREGMPVTRGMEIGVIDESEARANLAIKQFEYEVTVQKANSDINIRHAQAAAALADATLEALQEANRTAKGTVSAIEIKRSQLELKKNELAIEQTREEQLENHLTSKAKKAEVGAAQVQLDRRILTAPFDGVVTEVIKKPGEWIAIGEPVVHIVGIKRLRVMGNLDARQWGPPDVAGREVTVEVVLPRGRTVKVPGLVTYVSPVVTLDHMPVWAEIDVPMENDLPLIRAGVRGSMTIHVGRPVATAGGAPKTAPSVTRTVPAVTRTAPVRPAATRGVRAE